jgi:uncharacterized membrane protein YphA (DoxX/SURF4 family)
MDVVLVIGRVLFALLFINSGIAHLTKLEAMTGYAKYKKVPAATNCNHVYFFEQVSDNANLVGNFCAT